MFWRIWGCNCGFEITDGWLRYDWEDVGVESDGLTCPKCGHYLDWDIFQTDGHLQIMGVPYVNPIHSDSLALSPDQVAQHRKDFPNIEIDDQCRPVFTHQKTHQEYLDKCGIVKSKQKIRKRGKIFTKTGD